LDVPKLVIQKTVDVLKTLDQFQCCALPVPLQSKPLTGILSTQPVSPEAYGTRGDASNRSVSTMSDCSNVTAEPMEWSINTDLPKAFLDDSDANHDNGVSAGPLYLESPASEEHHGDVQDGTRVGSTSLEESGHCHPAGNSALLFSLYEDDDDGDVMVQTDPVSSLEHAVQSAYCHLLKELGKQSDQLQKSFDEATCPAYDTLEEFGISESGVEKTAVTGDSDCAQDHDYDIIEQIPNAIARANAIISRFKMLDWSTAVMNYQNDCDMPEFETWKSMVLAGFQPSGGWEDHHLVILQVDAECDNIDEFQDIVALRFPLDMSLPDEVEHADVICSGLQLFHDEWHAGQPLLMHPLHERLGLDAPCHILLISDYRCDHNFDEQDGNTSITSNSTLDDQCQEDT